MKSKFKVKKIKKVLAFISRMWVVLSEISYYDYMTIKLHIIKNNK